MNRLVVVILLFYSTQVYSQKFICDDGEVSFFSSAPMEDISARNNKVKAIYDSNTKELVFQLKITDFMFPNKLMQEHFNENYLESDIYPKSTFTGKVLSQNLEEAQVEGDLNIHGITNRINVKGVLRKERDKINISAGLIVSLADYNIDIPKIVMYKIAEDIEISVNVDLIRIK